MYHWIKRADSSRLVRYEGDRHGVTTDMYSIMYLTPDELRKSVAERTDRPLIHCEFAHAMGNGPGGLVDYVEAYRSEKLLQGGFVWQWCNHELLKKEGSLSYYAYGGDFGDYPNDADFILDGLVFSNHRETPGINRIQKGD